MSEVKVGDRVRVVIEGEVHHVTQDRFLDVAGVYYSSELGKYGVISIEVIAPLFVLPTKRWAQVTDNGVLWTLTHLGIWVNLHGNGRHATKLAESSHLRVISEGVGDEWA
jgi:hypothetical protein